MKRKFPNIKVGVAGAADGVVVLPSSSEVLSYGFA